MFVDVLFLVLVLVPLLFCFPCGSYTERKPVSHFAVRHPGVAQSYDMSPAGDNRLCAATEGLSHTGLSCRTTCRTKMVAPISADQPNTATTESAPIPQRAEMDQCTCSRCSLLTFTNPDGEEVKGQLISRRNVMKHIRLDQQERSKINFKSNSIKDKNYPASSASSTLWSELCSENSFDSKLWHRFSQLLISLMS